MLLGLEVHTRSRMVNSIMSSWKLVSGKLSLQVGKDFFPPHLSVHQLLCLLKFEIDLTEDQKNAIVAYCQVRRIGCATDFCEQNGAWRALGDIHGNRHGNRFSSLDTIRPLYEFL